MSATPEREISQDDIDRLSGDVVDELGVTTIEARILGVSIVNGYQVGYTPEQLPALYRRIGFILEEILKRVHAAKAGL